MIPRAGWYVLGTVLISGWVGLPARADEGPSVDLKIAFEEGTPLAKEVLSEFQAALKAAGVAFNVDRMPDYPVWPKTPIEFEFSATDMPTVACWIVASRINPDVDWAAQEAVQLSIVTAIRGLPSAMERPLQSGIAAPATVESLFISLGGGRGVAGRQIRVDHSDRLAVESVETWYIWLDGPGLIREVRLQHWCRLWAEATAASLALSEKHAREAKARKAHWDALALQVMDLSEGTLSRLSEEERQLLIQYQSTLSVATLEVQKLSERLEELIDSRTEPDRREIQREIGRVAQRPWLLVNNDTRLMRDKPREP